MTGDRSEADSACADSMALDSKLRRHWERMCTLIVANLLFPWKVLAPELALEMILIDVKAQFSKQMILEHCPATESKGSFLELLRNYFW